MLSKELHFLKGLAIPQFKTMLRPHCNGAPVQKSYFLQEDMRCGNVCVFDSDDTCYCGGQMKPSAVDNYDEWCCATSNCTVVAWFPETHAPWNASCPGTIQPLSKKCNGKCNYYPDVHHRDVWRSYVPACGNASDECVEESLLCRSIDPLCQNKEDLR